MSDKIQTAIRGVKAMDAEIVQWENRLQFVQDEVKRLNAVKDTLQAEIDQKTTDYNIYLAQRDSETKKIRQETVDLRMQFDKDRAEFASMLQTFQREKEELKHGQQILEAEQGKAKAKMDSVETFIMALKRDLSVLGI